MELCSLGGGDVPFWGVEMCQFWGVEMCWDEVNYSLLFDSMEMLSDAQIDNILGFFKTDL